MRPIHRRDELDNQPTAELPVALARRMVTLRRCALAREVCSPHEEATTIIVDISTKYPGDKVDQVKGRRVYMRNKLIAWDRSK